MTEKLVVPIEVTVARLERDLARITGSSVAAAKKVEGAFVAANNNVAGSFAKAGGAGKQQSDVISRSLKGSGFAVANLSAQLNDIGVSLAGGQSPFQVMIQQGTQVSQIMQQTGGSFKGFLSLFGQAVAGIINPVSLATFAIIGLGGAALQWAMSTDDAAEQASKALDDHIKDVKGVVDAWGETVPALKEYLAELEKARDIDLAKTVITAAIEKGWAAVTEQVNKASVEIAALQYTLQDMGQSTAAQELGNAWADLQKKIADNTATADDANEVAAKAAAFARETSIPAFQDLADTFSNLAIFIGSASDETAGLRSELEQTQDAALRMAAAREKALKTIAGRSIVDQTDDLEARMGIKPLKEKEKKTRKAKTPLQRYEDGFERKQLEVEAINAERDALAALNPFVEDYGRALDYAQTKQFLLAEAKKKDVELSPQQLSAIEMLANAHADATVEVEKLKEAQDKAVDTAKNFTETTKSALSGFIDDMRNGVTATEALNNALANVADRLVDIALNSFFDGAGGTGLTSFFGSLFGAGTPPTFASGGYTGPGGKNEPAGVVHKGEYVFSADATRKIGVGNLGSLARGYANGGYVGGSMPAMTAGPGGKPSVHVNVENTISDKASAGVEGSGTPGDPLRVVIEAVKKDIGSGGADAQLRSRYQLSPARRSR